MSLSEKNPRIRPISPYDNLIVATIIRQVLTEYGANREGFAFVDDELDALFEHFQPPTAAYFVAEVDGKVVGGAGFGPLLGGDAFTAELKKMYLLPSARGLGLGRQLIDQLIPLALQAGYRTLYLETTEDMKDASKLYEKSGFKRLDKPLGATGHFGCQVFYSRSLR